VCDPMRHMSLRSDGEGCKLLCCVYLCFYVVQVFDFGRYAVGIAAVDVTARQVRDTGRLLQRQSGDPFDGGGGGGTVAITVWWRRRSPAAVQTSRASVPCSTGPRQRKRHTRQVPGCRAVPPSLSFTEIYVHRYIAHFPT